jgi:serine/threonine protein kinase
LAGGGLAPRRAVELAVQIAHGLAPAHEKRIVHGDLKPDNLFVTRDGRVKILDFGLAKLLYAGAALHADLSAAGGGTEPGPVMGTVSYMSPQQVRGLPADARSEISSLGAVL